MLNKKSDFHFLIAASASCLLLLCIRIFYWQNLQLDIASIEGLMNYKGSNFIFLIWNLFLAWVPYLLTKSLPFFDQVRGKIGTFLIGFILIIWLLFFPNAPYLLTDLVHLKPRPLVPFWYDLLLLLSFAWTGLLLGLFSLFQLQNWIQNRFGKSYDRFLAITLIPLASLGVFLGRYLRWNSWEVFTQPELLLADLFQLFTDTELLSTGIGVVAGLSLFIFLIYTPFKMLQNNEN